MCIIISLITIIAGNIGSSDDFIGCHSKYKGIFEYWENIDSLFTYIDMTLCSSECPCNITTETQNAFSSHSFSNEFIDNIVNDGNATAFQDCPQKTIAKAQEYYERDEKASNGKLSNLNMDKFVSYWKYIENKFDCVGWCANSYWYTGNFSDVYVNGGFCKFLFSGVNKGVPKHAGCLKEMFKFVKTKIQVCGYIALVCSGSMFITWVAGLVMCCKLRDSFVLGEDVEGSGKGKEEGKKKKFKRSNTKMCLNEDNNDDNNNNIKRKNSKRSKKKTTGKKTKRNKDIVPFNSNSNNNNKDNDIIETNTQGNVPTVKTYADLNTERKFKHDITRETSESLTNKKRRKIKKKK